MGDRYHENIDGRLLELLQVYGGSGNEEKVTRTFSRFIRPYVDEVKVDRWGNVVAVKNGSAKGRRIMYVAHADEIALMITYIDEHGFLYFKEIGGIDTNLLPGTRVEIEGRNGSVIVGVIGKKPLHLQDREEAKKEYEAEDLCIDISATTKDEALAEVSLADVAYFPRNTILLNHHRIASCALDDRVGLYTLLRTAEQLSERQTEDTVVFVASVQEELGARGVRTVVDEVHPDVGIAVDVTHATDYPGLSPTKYGDIKIGGGCVIAVGPNIHPSVSGEMKGVAMSNQIACQIEPLARPTGTDANPMQLSRWNVMTGLISIPCRYMHTPNEIISMDDVESAASLLAGYIS
jgi:endoglucanase